MNPTEIPFDELVAERLELNTLIERGVHFTVQKRSPLKWFGSPERTFEIRQPFLGTLDHISRVSIDMELSEEELTRNPLGESRQLVTKNVRACAKVVAMAILNGYWRIRLFAPFLAAYLLWRLTPQKLLQLTLLINQISNLGDFINSIRLMSAKKARTTAPNLVEENQEPRV